ncbi:MAG: ATP-binding protein [bacterium]
MKNPFIKASAKKKHLKISLYGTPGVGKTFFALGFPAPAVIDLEGGTDFYADRFQFHVLDTKSYAEVLNAVNFLEQGDHDFKTLIIDPITVIWSALQEGRLEFKTQDPDKAVSGEEKSGFTYVDWMQIKRFYSLLMTKLVNLPMHVIMIGRLKDEYKVRGGEIVKIGVKMEAEKSTPYAPDICFRLEMEETKRVAVFEKDRTGHFDRGTRIDNPSFETFRPLIENSDCESQESHHDEVVRHHDETDAMRTDAEFFQQHEKSIKENSSMVNSRSDSGNSLSPQVLITKFSELKLKVPVEQYERYIYQKYGLSSVFQLSDKQVREQRNVLQKCEKDPQVKAQFETFLETGVVRSGRA